MSSTDMLKVPSNAGNGANGGAEYDTLSDVVMDDSRTTSRQPSVAPSVTGPAGPSKLGKSFTAGDNESDADDKEGEEEEDDESESESDDDDEIDEDGETSGKPMTPKQKQKAEDKRVKANARSAKKEKKKLQKANLNERRRGVGDKKAADSIKRFSYLLGQTDLFRHFIDLKKGRDPEFATLLAESEVLSEQKAANKKQTGRRGRKSEKQEDAELLAEANTDKDVAEGAEDAFVFTESPAYVKGGQMRDYQVQGLNWMVSLYHNGINGILADEMGLGKTLQTISFLGYLKFHRDIPGPHLVVVPKSTLDNWAREFDHWVPGFRTVILRGTKEERAVICQETLLTHSFDVCITSYEMCQREKTTLKKMTWEYVIIDEAHRIKNVNSILSQIIRLFDSRARLLITGTPLQNNLHELWALLNFLLPDVFSDVADFDAWFGGQSGGKSLEQVDDPNASAAAGEKKDEDKDTVVKQLHKVLAPFLLRRVKADVEKSLLPKKEINVYVGMTDMQRKWYKSLLEKDIDAVNGMGSKKEGKTRLLNIVMQLRKCCNHPYLFDGAEPGPPFTTDEHLVFNAGKMKVLDKLLTSMKAKGSRVLIFSQMSRVLDILEDYCGFRQYGYCRIDGSTSHEDRLNAIDEYNKPGSEKYVFLLTTRAGGLGINLTTADVVVLYDSDWNPQADLQAMDRAHRIGQKKQVYVFRFVTKDAVEEKVLERAAQKLRLDQLVIQQGRSHGPSTKAQGKEELVDMIQHGAQKIIDGRESMEVSDDIELIISEGERKTAELNAKYANLGFDDLHNFKSEAPGTREWEGTKYSGKAKQPIYIEPSKRERRNYASEIDAHAQRQQRRFQQFRIQGQVGDWQFFPPRLLELQDQELNFKKKLSGYRVPLPLRYDRTTLTHEDLLREQAEDQADIDNAVPLTEEEYAEKEELQAKGGFDSWTKRDYQAFIRGCEKFGRHDLDGVATEVVGKSTEEVKRYAGVFWERHHEVDDADRQIAKIEEAEKQHAKNARLTEMIKSAVAKYRHPLQQLSITYPLQNRTKTYTEEEDRFLVVALARHGIGSDEVYERIKRDVLEFPGFRFDWFIKSRTPTEIGRRCTTLIALVQKEHDPDSAKMDPVRKAKGPRKKNLDAENVVPNGKKGDANGDANSDAGSSVAAPPAKKPRKSATAAGSRSGTPRTSGRGKKKQID